MIINLFINLVLLIFGSLFVFLPEVSISSIPYIGVPFYNLLVSLVSMWNAFISTFPYAGIAWNVLLFVILPFEVLMLLGKFFLGHRMPSNHN